MKDFKRDIEEDDTIELIIRKDAETAVQYLRDNIEKLSAAVLDIESFINPDSDEGVESVEKRADAEMYDNKKQCKESEI